MGAGNGQENAVLGGLGIQVRRQIGFDRGQDESMMGMDLPHGEPESGGILLARGPAQDLQEIADLIEALDVENSSTPAPRARR